MSTSAIGYTDLLSILGPNLLGESFGFLLREPKLLTKIIQIAKRLEALHEYHPKQALFIAADIVRWRYSFKSDSKLNKETGK
jgi:hypothetical protein